LTRPTKNLGSTLENLNRWRIEDSASNRVVAEWLREEKLESLVPNPSKITGGEVIVKEMNGAARV